MTSKKSMMVKVMVVGDYRIAIIGKRDGIYDNGLYYTAQMKMTR